MKGMKKIKSVLLSMAALVFSATASLGGSICVLAETASAPTYNTFKMEMGASIRAKTLLDENGEAIESNGLKFCAEIDREEYDSLVGAGARFGLIIVAHDLLKAKGLEITPETVFGDSPAFYFTNESGGDTSKVAALHIASAACANLDSDANIEITGAIVNILTDNFTRSFVGRAYVEIPSINAETGEQEYTYAFAPYYENDIANNSRCIYYVAQKEVESKGEHEALAQEKYIDAFAQTDRFKNYNYRYNVEHHFTVHDENGEHVTVHTETTKHYATLNSTVSAFPIEKPDVEALKDLSFVFDVDESTKTRSGTVYAAGMQTLHLYYDKASDISEEHKADTLQEILANFLDKDNASHNFGLTMTEDGGVWEALPVYDPAQSNLPEEQRTQIGIALHATTNPNDNRTLILSKAFFEDLRAYGVESVTFDFHTAENTNKQIAFEAYQEELIDGERAELPVYDGVTGERLVASGGKGIETERVKIYLDDVTRGGGVTLIVHNSSSSNTGTYHFGNVVFGFPTQSLE